MEIWKKIDGYEGCYFVSNKWNIKSINKKIVSRNGSIKLKGETKLNPSVSNWGYHRVVLQLNGIRKHMRVHRLVATYFIPNPENKS